MTAITIELSAANDGWFHWVHHGCHRGFKTMRHLEQAGATCPYCGQSDGLLQFLTAVNEPIHGTPGHLEAHAAELTPVQSQPTVARKITCTQCHAVRMAYEAAEYCPICGHRDDGGHAT